MIIHLCGPPGSVTGRVALSLLDLAPNGVYLAEQITLFAGALLPHRFILACFRKIESSAVYFLWHFPSGHPDWLLASILLYGAPTFLDANAPRSPSRLTTYSLSG